MNEEEDKYYSDDQNHSLGVKPRSTLVIISSFMDKLYIHTNIKAKGVL